MLVRLDRADDHAMEQTRAIRASDSVVEVGPRELGFLLPATAGDDIPRILTRVGRGGAVSTFCYGLAVCPGDTIDPGRAPRARHFPPAGDRPGEDGSGEGGGDDHTRGPRFGAASGLGSAVVYSVRMRRLSERARLEGMLALRKALEVCDLHATLATGHGIARVADRSPEARALQPVGASRSRAATGARPRPAPRSHPRIRANGVRG